MENVRNTGGTTTRTDGSASVTAYSSIEHSWKLTLCRLLYFRKLATSITVLFDCHTDDCRTLLNTKLCVAIFQKPCSSKNGHVDYQTFDCGNKGCRTFWFPYWWLPSFRKQVTVHIRTFDVRTSTISVLLDYQSLLIIVLSMCVLRLFRYFFGYRQKRKGGSMNSVQRRFPHSK